MSAELLEQCQEVLDTPSGSNTLPQRLVTCLQQLIWNIPGDTARVPDI